MAHFSRRFSTGEIFAMPKLLSFTNGVGRTTDPEILFVVVSNKVSYCIFKYILCINKTTSRTSRRRLTILVFLQDIRKGLYIIKHNIRRTKSL